MPRLFSAAIIALSLMVVIGYYVIYPILFSKMRRERSEWERGEQKED